MHRPIPAVVRDHAEAARFPTWVDNLCLDSPDDDPVWAGCLQLGGRLPSTPGA